MKSRLGWMAILLLLAGGVAVAATGFQDGGTESSGVQQRAWTAWLIAPIGAVVALIFAIVFFKQMKQASPGNETMVRIAGHVKTGAMAYLKQQFTVVGIVVVILSGLLCILAFVMRVQPWLVPFAFLTGAFFSGLCGFLGMRTATEASSRTAEGARQNLNQGLQIALRSGAVMGLVVVGLGLIDIVGWFWILQKLIGWSLHKTTVTMLAFGMGASTQALFARVGGGIYTKAADVGADLVGKVEAGIPEDDPRNPATIADNVGDNVGDVAGMGADLYESFCGSILATAAIGYAAANSLASQNAGIGSLTEANEWQALPWIMLPMVIAGVGNILSVIGIYAVRSKEDTSLKSLMAALFRGINLSTGLVVVLSLVAAVWLMGGSELLPQTKIVDGKEVEISGFLGIHPTIMGIWISIVAGLLAGWVIGKATEYYTSNDYKPTQQVSESSKYGPATVIIQGTAVGMMSVAIPVIAVGSAITLAFIFTGGFQDPIQGLYGVSIAAVGMLSTLGITLATDAYGPIADNAGGNAQMAGLPPEVRERTDSLDALGNTTAATGKGFAIGSAALTGLALLAAYMEEIKAGLKNFVEAWNVDIPQKWVDAGITSADQIKDVSIMQLVGIYEITIMNPKVLVGIFIGSMMAFVFCAMTMKAVGRAAESMVGEVRRQFKEIPGIMEGKADPEYAPCVMIATKGAQREMILPSLTAIIVPIVVGLIFDIGGVVGLLAGTLSTGFVLAIMMASSGGCWDNAKKWIEKGHHGGKGSDAHKATVIGDTVGDPFKDTSGPSLNILIKLMSMVSVVFVGLVIVFGPKIAKLLGM